MADSFRFGILGAGAVGELHARAIQDLDNATLVAAARRSEAPGRRFAQEHDCRWYADYERLLEEEAPDVVTVATPSGAHLEPTVAAAEQGVHVLCEKPLEITVDRIDQMVETAQVRSVKLGGIFQQRFSDVVRAVRKAVGAGRFGNLAVATASVPWWRADAYYEGTWKGTQALDGGGALMNQAIHAIDAIAWIASAGMDLEPDENPVEEVYAYTDVRGHDPAHVEVEDTAVATMKYRDGTLGQVLGATSMYPGHSRRLRVAGRDGTAEICGETLTCWQFREERPQDEDIRTAHGEGTEANGASDPMAIDYDKHTRNIRAFLDWVDDEAVFGLHGTEARKAVNIIESIYESAASGRPARVE